MFLFPDKQQHSQGWVPRPRWARGRTPPKEEGAFSSQGRSPHPELPGADVVPGGVFFSSSYLKKKQNSPHSPHVKCLSCCRQTIILQSHNDPCAEKRGKARTAPRPSLGESTSGKAQVAEDQTHSLRNNRRWGGRWGRGLRRRKHKV